MGLFSSPKWHELEKWLIPQIEEIFEKIVGVSKEVPDATKKLVMLTYSRLKIVEKRLLFEEGVGRTSEIHTINTMEDSKCREVEPVGV